MKNKFNPGCSCDCAPPNCADCSSWSVVKVRILGTVHADCPTGCGLYQGTFVFRSVSDPIPNDCAWTITTVSYDCASDGDYVRIGTGSHCITPLERAVSTIELQLWTDTSLYYADVFISCSHHDYSGFTGWGNRWDVRFQRSSATCAGLAGALTKVSDLKSQDCWRGSTLGDYCDIGSLGVTLLT